MDILHLSMINMKVKPVLHEITYSGDHKRKIVTKRQVKPQLPFTFFLFYKSITLSFLETAIPCLN
jgi:hypothetical protein